MLRRFLFALLLIASHASAQVAIDGEAVLQGHNTSADPQPLGNKTTAGSDRLGVACVHFTNAAFASEPNDITWSGSILANEIGSGVVNGTAGGIRCYYKIAPPTASTAVDVDLTTASPVGFCVASFNGVHQTTPISGANTATGSDTTPTVTITSSANSLVVSVATAANTFSATGSMQTAFCDFTDGSSYAGRASYESGGSSVVMDYTISSAAWANIGFSIDEVSAGGNTSLRRRRD